jgi:hypothetical protein
MLNMFYKIKFVGCITNFVRLIFLVNHPVFDKDGFTIFPILTMFKY